MLAFIEELTAFYSEYLAFQEEKKKVLISRNQNSLKNIAVREQPFFMRAKGFDRKYRDLLKTWKIKNVKLSDVIQNMKFVNEDEKIKTQQAYAKFKTIFKKFEDLLNELIRITKGQLECCGNFAELVSAAKGEQVDIIF
jgi:hypothetical protein